MAKAKRRLSDVDVKFISLVGKGANGKTIIWKSDAGYRMPDAGWEKEIPILKIDDEKRVVFGIVYSPDEVDSQGDTMTAAEIEKMAYRFMENRRTDKIDKDHDEKADEGFVAETWLVKKGDPVFADQPAGSWAVGIKVTDNATWKLVKSGKIGGLSMGGEGKAEPVEKYSVSSDQYSDKDKGMIRRLFEKFFGESDSVEKDFAGSFNNRVFKDAIWGLNDALLEIMRNANIVDKRAALVNSVNQFVSFINNLKEVPVMEKTDKKDKGQQGDNSQYEKSLELVEKLKKSIEKGDQADTGETKDDPVELLKALQESLKGVNKDDSGDLSKKMLELVEKLNENQQKVIDRLGKLEKAHPGKTAAESQDGGEKVEKNHKGFAFV